MRKFWLAAAAALLLMLCAASPALAEKAKDITSKCQFLVSEGSTYNIRDDSMSSAWRPSKKNAEMRVKMPASAAYIQINWTISPTNYTLTEYDKDLNAIASHSAEEDSFACISQLFTLNEQTRYIFLSFSKGGQGINKVRVFTEGTLPNTVIAWEPPHDKCDLLVVSTHEDDEWLWFGAIIPYYDLVKDKKVQVVYMANCGRLRYGEALNSIAVSGVRTYPLFVGLKDKHDKSIDDAIKTWKSRDYILEVMVKVIRRFKPEVILTHDWNGEYGHPQHKLTSRCMEYAIDAAADPAQYPDSAQEFGAWQVKKLYRHLEKKDQIEFDWHVPYEEFGGRTGIQVATDSMNQHASQLKYYQVQDHGKYDNALFGLSYSTVGRDQLHEDLFENIPETAEEPAAEAAEQPAAEGEAEAEEDSLQPAQALVTEAPEAEAAPEIESEATAEPSGGEELEGSEPEAAGQAAAPLVTAPPEPAKESGGSALPIAIGGVAIAAVGGGAAFALYRRAQLRKRRRRRRPRPAGTSAKSAARPRTQAPNNKRTHSAS